MERVASRAGATAPGAPRQAKHTVAVAVERLQGDGTTMETLIDSKNRPPQGFPTAADIRAAYGYRRGQTGVRRAGGTDSGGWISKGQFGKTSRRRRTKSAQVRLGSRDGKHGGGGEPSRGWMMLVEVLVSLLLLLLPPPRLLLCHVIVA